MAISIINPSTVVKATPSSGLQKAHYLMEKLGEIGCKLVFDKPLYNEFVVKVNDSKKVSEELLKDGIIGGLELGKHYPELSDCLLFCVTELNTIHEIDRLVEVIKECS